MDGADLLAVAAVDALVVSYMTYVHLAVPDAQITADAQVGIDPDCQQSNFGKEAVNGAQRAEKTAEGIEKTATRPKTAAPSV